MASYNLLTGGSPALRIPIPRILAAALFIARPFGLHAGLPLLRKSEKRRPTATRHPLLGLPAHLLRDVGFERGEVGFAASFGRLPARHRARLRGDRRR